MYVYVCTHIRACSVIMSQDLEQFLMFDGLSIVNTGTEESSTGFRTRMSLDGSSTAAILQFS